MELFLFCTCFSLSLIHRVEIQWDFAKLPIFFCLQWDLNLRLNSSQPLHWPARPHPWVRLCKVIKFYINDLFICFSLESQTPYLLCISDHQICVLLQKPSLFVFACLCKYTKYFLWMTAADVFLWRDKKVTAGVLGFATVIWALFELLEYHLLTLVCHILIVAVAVLFLWSNASAFINTYVYFINL